MTEAIIPSPLLPMARGDLRNLPVNLEKDGDYYAKLLRNCHDLVPHSCPGGTWCTDLGLKWHYRAKPDIAPAVAFVGKTDYLWGFGAFRAQRSATAAGILKHEPTGTKKDQYRKGHDRLVDIVEPLRGFTLLCDFPEDLVAAAYDWTRSHIGGVVECTKELHAEVPDLFLIIDREQIFDDHGWEMGWGLDPDMISGETYVKKFLVPARAAMRSMVENATVVQLPGRCVVLPEKAEALFGQLPLPRHPDNLAKPAFRYTAGKLVDDSLRNQYRLLGQT